MKLMTQNEKIFQKSLLRITCTRPVYGRLNALVPPARRADPPLDPDCVIAIGARKAILHISAIAEEKVRVEVRNGVVILRGELDDWHLRNTIEQAATTPDNVVTVVNDILLKPQKLSFAASREGNS